MTHFTDKVVLITGSSSGIGAQTAVDFARAGAKVAITGRNANNLQQTADRCRAIGAKEENVFSICGDLTLEEDVNRVVDAVVQHFKTIHVLVNNAGAVVQGGLESMTISGLDSMYMTNVRAVVMVTKRALDPIIENKGAIVNVTSVAGNRPIHYCMPYTMMKAAVNSFTQCLANELAPKGVRVNAVAPGMIDTPIFIRPGGHMEHTPEKIAEFYASGATAHPMGRVGSVQEVSQAILFLASDAASFTTGAIFPVDGGRHATVANPGILTTK